jgi:hypothetical protein
MKDKEFMFRDCLKGDFLLIATRQFPPKIFSLNDNTYRGILRSFCAKIRVSKKYFGTMNFLSDVTGCRKTHESDCTGSTVLSYILILAIK